MSASWVSIPRPLAVLGYMRMDMDMDHMHMDMDMGMDMEILAHSR